MNHSIYMQNLLENFLTTDEVYQPKIMFIKHYNSLNMRLEDIETMVGDKYKDGLLYHRYSKNDIKEPYEPLVTGIRYYYQKLFSKEMSVEEFIDNCEVYSLHKDILISYLKDGLAVRNEPIINVEASYEKNRFAKSIINCIKYIGEKTNLMIVLDRFHLAAYSTLKVIDEIIKNNDNAKTKFLIIFDELQSPSSYIESYYRKIINDAENDNILFEWESDNVLGEYDYHTAFIPSKRYFPLYLENLNNLLEMLAIEDAEYYMSIIYNRFIEENLSIERRNKCMFYYLRAKCAVIREDIKLAMLMCEKLLPLINDDDLEEKYSYNYVCCLTHINLIQSDLSTKYAANCIAYAKQLNDERRLLNAKVLEISSQFAGWHDVFSVDFEKVNIDNDMIKALRDAKYYNTLAYYIIFGCDNDDESVKRIAIGEESEYFKEGISLGKKINNTNFLLSAYTKYIILSSEKGYPRVCEKYYKEKLAILKQEHNLVRTTHLYLGIGYNSIVSEQYLKANDYFGSAIKILYELKNPETICEALYNMSINAICAQDFISAGDYLNNIFKMLDNLKIETIQICNASKLQGLLALCYYMRGNEYRCYKCLDKVEMLVDHLLNNDEEENDYYRWHEDLFLYYFINSNLAKRQGSYDKALTLMNKANEHYKMNEKALFYIIINYVYECYDLYKKLGRDDKAEEIYDYGIKYCAENGYNIKSTSITTLVNNQALNVRPFGFNIEGITLDDLVELSYNVGKEKQLAERKKDIKFLSSFQEMANQDNIDSLDLVKNIMTTLENNFNLDGVLFLERKDELVELYRDGMNEKKSNYKDILLFFNLMKREFMINRTDKKFFEFDKIISYFDKNKLVTFIGIPIINERDIKFIFIATVNMHRNFRRNRILLNEDDLAIIKTAIIQLSNGIERIRNKKKIIEVNDKLNILAVSDQLTGLYNRQGLAKLLDENYSENRNMAIMYADLDNFKYYNDTFGHDVGDIILCEFANIYKTIADNHKGFAIRYGGDEFLVILFDVTREKVEKAADEIYEIIKDGFVDKVSSYTKKKVEIPEDKLVTCSIGISIARQAVREDVMDTLKKADEALYYIKKNSKGIYKFWDDING